MRLAGWVLFVWCALHPFAAHSQHVSNSSRWPAGVSFPKATTSDTGVEVVGGTPSTERKVVGIFYKDRQGTPRLCSGLWIAKHYILTAAHCTCHNNDYLVTTDEVMFGNGRLNNSAIWRNAILNQRFPGVLNTICSPRAFSAGDDLALLTLSSPLPTGGGTFACEDYSLYDSIKLGKAWTESDLRSLTIAGFGYEGDVANSQGRRRQGRVSITSFTCRRPVDRALGCISFAEFIAGSAPNARPPIDSCSGDSGGPAYVMQGGNFIPIGIVSRGVPVRQPYAQRGQCGAGGIYQHIGRRDVLAWLKRSGVLPGKSDCSQ